MIAIAPDEVTTAAYNLLLECRLGVEELPAENGIEHQQAQFICSRHEVRRLRIVRKAHQIETCLLDALRIAVVGLRRYRIADVGILLVTIDATQEHPFAIDPEPGSVDLDPTDAHRRTTLIDERPSRSTAVIS